MLVMCNSPYPILKAVTLLTKGKTEESANRHARERRYINQIMPGVGEINRRVIQTQIRKKRDILGHQIKVGGQGCMLCLKSAKG